MLFKLMLQLKSLYTTVQCEWLYTDFCNVAKYLDYEGFVDIYLHLFIYLHINKLDVVMKAFLNPIYNREAYNKISSLILPGKKEMSP